MVVLLARLTAFAVFGGILALGGSAASETVTFDVMPALSESVTLSAELIKPQGAGPFPAVVLMHGCNGLWRPWGGLWAGRLVRWGYVTVRVDSFGPRGHPDGICDTPLMVYPLTRAADAHAAKDYLMRLPFVDQDRIAVMGMSHGGSTTLAAVENTYIVELPRAEPFGAAIAFYPWCGPRLYRLDAPLLVLIGEADDWTYAFKCERMVLVDRTEHNITLKVYPGATHAFDIDRPYRVYLGHTMRFHPSAARDAEARVRSFLAEHLNDVGPPVISEPRTEESMQESP